MQDNNNIYDDLLESRCFLSVDEFRYKLLNAVHNGFDVNYQREKGNIKRTLLTESFIEIEPPACDMLKVLIDCGANVNVQLNDSRMTPLMICVQGALSKQYEITQTLLTAGADPNAQSLDGTTAFSICAKCYCIHGGKYSDILQLLLKAGANPFLCRDWEILAATHKNSFQAQKNMIYKIIEEIIDHKEEITAQKSIQVYMYDL